MPIIFYLLVVGLFIASIRLNKKGYFLDKDASNAIKGFFIVLVVFSHILNAFPYLGWGYQGLDAFRELLGQLIVTMFFFISGYGITLSISKKGDEYSKSILTNRFLRILLYTIISLVPFFILSAVFNHSHPVGDYFLACIGLVSFGNSAWFIFAILVTYFASAVVYLFNYKNKWLPLVLVTLLIIVYMVVMGVTNQDPISYNTIIAFPIGMFVAYFVKPINEFFDKHKKVNIILIVVFAAIGAGLRGIDSLFLTGVWSVLMMVLENLFFCLFFVAFTKIFTFKSKIFSYLGTGSYGIYLIHRVVIVLFSELGTIPNEWANYAVMFISALLIGLPFNYLYRVIDKFIVDPIVNWNRKLIKKDDEVVEQTSSSI